MENEATFMPELRAGHCTKCGNFSAELRTQHLCQSCCKSKHTDDFVKTMEDSAEVLSKLRALKATNVLAERSLRRLDNSHYKILTKHTGYYVCGDIDTADVVIVIEAYRKLMDLIHETP